jgi:hypothetical protein
MVSEETACRLFASIQREMNELCAAFKANGLENLLPKLTRIKLDFWELLENYLDSDAEGS